MSAGSGVSALLKNVSSTSGIGVTKSSAVSGASCTVAVALPLTVSNVRLLRAGGHDKNQGGTRSCVVAAPSRSAAFTVVPFWLLNLNTAKLGNDGMKVSVSPAARLRRAGAVISCCCCCCGGTNWSSSVSNVMALLTESDSISIFTHVRAAVLRVQEVSAFAENASCGPVAEVRLT